MSRAPLWVFYDGTCGMCSRAVAWALARDVRGELRAEPAQSPLALAQLGLPAERLLRELHVWSAEGGVASGSDAVAALLLRLPRWAWAGALLRLAPVRPLARLAYGWVAARRQWFGSPACALPAPVSGAQAPGGRTR